MTKKKIFKDIENFLQSVVPPTKEDDLDALNITDNPNDILDLIAKYERMAAKLAESGDSEGVEEVLHKITKLRMVLLNLFKRQQRKLLEQYWQELSEENEKFSKKLAEQLDSFREQVIGKNVFEIKK